MRAVLSLADVDDDVELADIDYDGGVVEMLREGLELPDSGTPTTGGTDKLDEGTNDAVVMLGCGTTEVCVCGCDMCARVVCRSYHVMLCISHNSFTHTASV